MTLLEGKKRKKKREFRKPSGYKGKEKKKKKGGE